MPKNNIHQLSINTIRCLAIDAIQKANSGHPGMPMGCAPIAYMLYTKYMKHNPENPGWVNRDRFILSAGHGSMLLYSILHLCGYEITLDDIKNFRQWKSKTAGHPEYRLAPGVETTTGPLGQGFMNGLRPKSSLNNTASVPSQSSSQSKSPRHWGSSVQGLVKALLPKLTLNLVASVPSQSSSQSKLPSQSHASPIPLPPGDGSISNCIGFREEGQIYEILLKKLAASSINILTLYSITQLSPLTRAPLAWSFH